jgi:hypothetical protein
VSAEVEVVGVVLLPADGPPLDELPQAAADIAITSVAAPTLIGRARDFINFLLDGTISRGVFAAHLSCGSKLGTLFVLQ